MNYFEVKALQIYKIMHPGASLVVKDDLLRITGILFEVALAGRIDSHIAELAMNGGSGG